MRSSPRCRICGRPLVRVTKAVSSTCSVHAKVDVLEPGNCPICKRMLKVKYSRRPHGDHNPKHGGLFFMAPNNWHLEATCPSRGLVRLYVVSVPFRKSPGKLYLEAHVAQLAVPASIVVKVRFQPSDPEYLFNFDFLDYSREPAALPVKANSSAGRSSD